MDSIGEWHRHLFPPFCVGEIEPAGCVSKCLVFKRLWSFEGFHWHLFPPFCVETVESGVCASKYGVSRFPPLREYVCLTTPSLSESHCVPASVNRKRPLSRNARYIVMPVREPGDLRCIGDYQSNKTTSLWPKTKDVPCLAIIARSENFISRDDIENAIMLCHRHIAPRRWDICVDARPSRSIRCRSVDARLCIDIECAIRRSKGVKDWGSLGARLPVPTAL